MNYTIRAIKPDEYNELENFIYEAIYIPKDTPAPQSPSSHSQNYKYT